MNDKEIVYNIIERYIDNLLVQLRNPLLMMVSEPLKNYLFRYLNPYIDAFTTNNTFEIEEASSFLEQEAINKIKLFKKNFKESKDENIKDNF